MVSVVCGNALNSAVRESGQTAPGMILDAVRKFVISTFSGNTWEQTSNTFPEAGSEVKDGMDISLCALNKKSGTICWSGANNPLWYIRDGQLVEIKPNKQAIGRTENPVPFTTHEMSVQPGDCIYLFTDGYADQFGGPKGKKFKQKQLWNLLLENHKKPMPEQKKILDEQLSAWKGKLEQVDDILVIGFRV